MKEDFTLFVIEFGPLMMRGRIPAVGSVMIVDPSVCAYLHHALTETTNEMGQIRVSVPDCALIECSVQIEVRGVLFNFHHFHG